MKAKIISENDKARKYLIDKTYSRYINNKLAGDFVWKIASVTKKMEVE